MLRNSSAALSTISLWQGWQSATSATQARSCRQGLHVLTELGSPSQMAKTYS
jgi:hypothetical protein